MNVHVSPGEKKMYRLWIRCLFVLFVLCIVPVNFFVGSASVSAHSTSAGPLNIDALQQKCAMLAIHSGPKPTTTCLEKREIPLGQKGARRPNLNSSFYCSWPTASLIIINYDGYGVLCFDGDGYLDVQIFMTNTIVSQKGWYDEQGWLHYNRFGIGNFCEFASNSTTYFGSGYTNVTLTQINVGGRITNLSCNYVAPVIPPQH